MEANTLIRLYNGEHEFFIEAQKLSKSGYFKSLMEFNNAKSVYEITEINIEFEPEIFKFIIEHMKYDNISNSSRLLLPEIEKIKQMSNYLLYEPLMNLNIGIEPATIIKLKIYGDRDGINIQLMSPLNDYIIYMLQKKNPMFVYYDKVNNELGSKTLDHFYITDEITKKTKDNFGWGSNTNNNNMESIKHRFSIIYIIITEFINDLNLSINKIICFDKGDGSSWRFELNVAISCLNDKLNSIPTINRLLCDINSYDLDDVIISNSLNINDKLFVIVNLQTLKVLL